MKNCDVAELGSLVRAMARVPGTLAKPAFFDDSDSIGIGGFGRLLLEVGGEPAALDHEAIDDTMELRADVCVRFSRNPRKFATVFGAASG
jgi:hypothetical protein